MAVKSLLLRLSSGNGHLIEHMVNHLIAADPFGLRLITQQQTVAQYIGHHGLNIFRGDKVTFI
ncbi:MAG: hypothetical protein Sw2PiMacB_24560 [Shewanella algae]